MANPAYIDEATGALTDGEAWVGITSTTLGSDAATVAFTSTDNGEVGDFSQYLDLIVLVHARGAASSADAVISIRINNDTTSVYTQQKIQGDGGGGGANAWKGTIGYGQLGSICGNSAGANMFGAVVIHLFDINSGKYKDAIAMGGSEQDDDASNGKIDTFAVTYQSQASISTFYLFSSTGNIMAGSRLDLFGILPRMVA